jgi:ketosteroid isomerase-like protein
MSGPQHPLHEAVCAAYNAGDVDAMVALYEPDAWLFGPSGPVQGHDAIRAVWDGFVALGGRLTMTTRYAVEHGDHALLSNQFVMVIGDMEVSAATAEVARRGADGTWRYVIDNPDAAGVLEA